jgi:predicted dehydrogenase
MRVYRIGVIGLGQRIAHVLSAMSEVGWRFEVAHHVDPDPVGAPIMAASGLSMGAALPDVATLLAEGPYDLVMIGSPNHLHYQHLTAALDAGFAIFCEKPIVRTPLETELLARRLAAPNCPPVFVGLVMRSMPIVREVIQRIDSGQMGELISIDATEHLHPEHGAYLARNWRRKTDWGGSYLLDKVCHDFDIFNRMTGARAARVASFGGRRIFHPDRAGAPRTYSDGQAAYGTTPPGWAGSNDAFQSDMDVTDHQVALVEYENNVRLSFHANSHVALQERRWYLAGTGATLVADLVRNRLTLRETLAKGRPEKIEFGGLTDDNHNGADQAMARDLKSTFEEGAAFPVTPQDSMVAGLTVMAIDQAMAESAVVDCAPIWAAYDAAVRRAGPA